MPTWVIGCANDAAAREHMLAFGLERKTIKVGKMTTGAVLDNETPDWDSVRYLVIATSADIKGPFDPASSLDVPSNAANPATDD